MTTPSTGTLDGRVGGLMDTKGGFLREMGSGRYGYTGRMVTVGPEGLRVESRTGQGRGCASPSRKPKTNFRF